MGLSLIHLPLCWYPHLWKPPVKYVYHLLRIGSRYSMGFLGMVFSIFSICSWWPPGGFQMDKDGGYFSNQKPGKKGTYHCQQE